MSVISDQPARRLALDPGRSFLVQAPAGSGKTELLTQRILALLGTVRHPGEVLAITFTRKAAAEMRQRLLQALERARDPSPPAADHARQTWSLARRALEQDRARGWDLLATPGLLAIQTIDSFNAALARRMPWVSRFGGMPRMSEDPRPLYRLAVRRTLDRFDSGKRGQRAVARLLEHLDNRVERLEEMLLALLQRRDQWLRHLGGGEVAGERECLEKALAKFVAEVLALGHRSFPEGWRDPLVKLGRYAAQQAPGPRPLVVLRDLADLPGACPKDLDLWRGLADLLLTSAGTLRRTVDKNGGFPAGKDGPEAQMKQEMLALLADPAIAAWAPVLGRIRELPDPVYDEGQWAVLDSLVEVLNLAVAELWLVFGEHGEADFAEVALRALWALQSEEDPSDLLLRLDAEIRHILVDEFQDTSHLQFALLQSLTSGWEPGDGRTLFLVGDPMQSIYRFREAEVGLFLRARQAGIGTIALDSLTLSANFRSRAGVVNWVNGSFARVFPAVGDPARGAVAHAAAEAVHPADPEPAVEVHPAVGRDDAAEAALVADLARQALAAGDDQVAILVRARSHLREILPALRQAGLRYLAQDVDLLAARPVARDLVSLARALLHRGDRLSWLAVLRAPWCGLTLAELHALGDARPETDLPALLAEPETLDRLPAAAAERARRLWSILRHGREQRGRLPLRRLVEGCWLALGGPVCYGPTDREDAAKVFELLESLDSGGELEGLEALEEGLQRLYAAADVQADGRLQVLTIHKAKGLEFDTVILPGLGQRPARRDAPLLRWGEHPEHGLLLAPIAARDGSRDPIYDVLGRWEQEKDQFEAVRVAYVAVTRARRKLHLVGHAEGSGRGPLKPAEGSLLSHLWPVLASAFPASETPAGKLAGEALLPPGGLKRLPEDWVRPTLVPAPIQAAAIPLTPSQTVVADSGHQAAGRAARQAGTVLHLLLERIARQGLAVWPPSRIGELAEEVSVRLRREGVSPERAAVQRKKILGGLATAVTGARGRWILGAWPEAASEQGLSSPEVPLGVVDRTFVDHAGVRWIVDYKSSEPEPGQAAELFMENEARRYRDQLAGYARLYAALDARRPVRAGLYFPLFDGWQEVAL